MNPVIFKKPVVLLTALSVESKVVLETSSHEIILKEKQLNLYKLAYKTYYILEIGKGFSCPVDRVGTVLQTLDPVLLLNYGFCGALNPDIMTHKFYSVNRIFSVSNKSITINKNLPSPIKDTLKKYPSKTLLTVDKPVLSEIVRQRYYEKKKCDLVDMEAFKIAQLANRLSLSLLVFKLISDNANEETQTGFRKKLPQLKEELRKNILSLLENLIF